MRTFCWKQVIVIVAGLSTLPVVPAGAQDRPESGPTLEARIQPFKTSGGPAGMAMVGDWAIAGQAMKWFLTAGHSNPAEPSVCGYGAGDVGTLADKLSRAAFVWELKVVPSKIENGLTTFDLEWARYQADGGGRAAVEAKTTLTLREGERRTIDLVHGTLHGCDSDTAVVDVAAGYKEDRQFANTVLQYEIWLTHRRTANDAVVRKFVGMGRQGASVDFSFVPVRSTIDVTTPDRVTYDVFTTVQGTVHGRLQPNGRIALTVDTSRRDGLGPQTTGPSGSSGNSGRKLLDVAPDETIEIELPAPGGRSSTGARGAAAAPRSATPTASQRAVSVDNGRVTVDNALFFQGQRTSLIVKVTPVRQ